MQTTLPQQQHQHRHHSALFGNRDPHQRQAGKHLPPPPPKFQFMEKTPTLRSHTIHDDSDEELQVVSPILPRAGSSGTTLVDSSRATSRFGSRDDLRPLPHGVGVTSPKSSIGRYELAQVDTAALHAGDGRLAVEKCLAILRGDLDIGRMRDLVAGYAMELQGSSAPGDLELDCDSADMTARPLPPKFTGQSQLRQIPSAGLDVFLRHVCQVNLAAAGTNGSAMSSRVPQHYAYVAYLMLENYALHSEMQESREKLAATTQALRQARDDVDIVCEQRDRAFRGHSATSEELWRAQTLVEALSSAGMDNFGVASTNHMASVAARLSASYVDERGFRFSDTDGEPPSVSCTSTAATSPTARMLSPVPAAHTLERDAWFANGEDTDYGVGTYLPDDSHILSNSQLEAVALGPGVSRTPLLCMSPNTSFIEHAQDEVSLMQSAALVQAVTVLSPSVQVQPVLSRVPESAQHCALLLGPHCGVSALSQQARHFGWLLPLMEAAGQPVGQWVDAHSKGVAVVGPSPQSPARASMTHAKWMPPVAARTIPGSHLCAAPALTAFAGASLLTGNGIELLSHQLARSMLPPQQKEPQSTLFSMLKTPQKRPLQPRPSFPAIEDTIDSDPEDVMAFPSPQRSSTLLKNSPHVSSPMRRLLTVGTNAVMDAVLAAWMPST
ncbi:hypothetical protein BC828DRAFT_378779 [Blastocladiella britannica]|nr:hypothetical protein BC828DRAFT_378779 [Blastocladiella britannica]